MINHCYMTFQNIQNTKINEYHLSTNVKHGRKNDFLMMKLSVLLCANFFTKNDYSRMIV